MIKNKIVATVLTACGIETIIKTSTVANSFLLQQYLPLAVLKPHNDIEHFVFESLVATVLTACGIETYYFSDDGRHYRVATVLTACGIETPLDSMGLR